MATTAVTMNIIATMTDTSVPRWNVKAAHMVAVW